MRKLVVGTFLTLDGVMQAPGGPDEDREGGFEHGGWLGPFFDEKMGAVMSEWMAESGGFLLGRKTYEIFANYWPLQTDPDDVIAAALNREPKYVASRTLNEAAWNNSRVLKGDVAAEVAKLKAEDGGQIQVHGSANLIQTLLQNDLIDEFRLWFFPVVLGKGKRLFGGGTMPARFRLTGTETSTTGVALHVYERAGAVQYTTVGA
jgi:dihydrofolate reductase